jgi:hypothetical protein
VQPKQRAWGINPLNEFGTLEEPVSGAAMMFVRSVPLTDRNARGLKPPFQICAYSLIDHELSDHSNKMHMQMRIDYTYIFPSRIPWPIERAMRRETFIMEHQG